MPKMADPYTLQVRELPYKWKQWAKQCVFGGYAPRSVAEYYAVTHRDRAPSNADFEEAYKLDCTEYTGRCKARAELFTSVGQPQADE